MRARTGVRKIRQILEKYLRDIGEIVDKDWRNILQILEKYLTNIKEIFGKKL